MKAKIIGEKGYYADLNGQIVNVRLDNVTWMFQDPRSEEWVDTKLERLEVPEGITVEKFIQKSIEAGYDSYTLSKTIAEMERTMLSLKNVDILFPNLMKIIYVLKAQYNELFGNAFSGVTTKNAVALLNL